ncbi:hypothetical protein D3C72_2079860 [compost metagenome]
MANSSLPTTGTRVASSPSRTCTMASPSSFSGRMISRNIRYIMVMAPMMAIAISVIWKKRSSVVLRALSSSTSRTSLSMRLTKAPRSTRVVLRRGSRCACASFGSILCCQ